MSGLRAKIRTDSMSFQADARRFPDIGQQYLQSMAKFVPGAFVRETPKASGWLREELSVLRTTSKDEQARWGGPRAIQGASSTGLGSGFNHSHSCGSKEDFRPVQSLIGLIPSASFSTAHTYLFQRELTTYRS